VGKIPRGAKPGELPVEQPTKYQPIVYPKLAKALGITIPHSILLRIDKVIRYPRNKSLMSAFGYKRT